MPARIPTMNNNYNNRKMTMTHEEKALEILEKAINLSGFDGFIGTSIILSDASTANKHMVNIPFNMPFCSKKVLNKLAFDLSKGATYFGMIIISHPDSPIGSLAMGEERNLQTIADMVPDISPETAFDNYPFKVCSTVNHCLN